MEIIHSLYLLLDFVLIAPYRLFSGGAGFALGTFVLTLWCILLGEASGFLAFLFNRKHYAEQMNEMVRMHNLSVRAIRHKDKESYKASNHWANEYFGKVFFAHVALFAVTIWPVPFALAWMGTRFSEILITVPISGGELTYVAVFLLIYIPVRIVFSRIKKRIPFFQRMGLKGSAGLKPNEPLLSWSDLGASQDRVHTQNEKSPPEGS
ncbi:MAG: hypothetical protein ACOC0U_00700 [Desulfovibrionales bacterium]